MAGHENGHHLVAQLPRIHGAPGLCVARLQEPGQKILGLAARGGLAPHQPVDHRVEMVEDVRPAARVWPGPPVRQVQQIDQARPHLPLIAADGFLDDRADVVGLRGKHGAGDDLEREAHHLRGDIERRAVGQAIPPRQQRSRGLGHGGRIAHEAAMVEGRRHGAALAAPGIAFAGEQAAPDARLDEAPRDPALHVIAGVVEQDALYAARRIHDEVALPEDAPLDHGSLEHLLAVGRNRAVPQRAQEAQQGHAPAKPRRRGEGGGAHRLRLRMRARGRGNRGGLGPRRARPRI